MTGTLRRGIVVSLALLLAACSIQQSMEGAERQVGKFHELLDERDFAAIWQMTAPQFREITTQGDFDKLLDAVHRKLGGVKTTTRTGWQANNTNGLSTIVVLMETEFEQGKGQETFTFLSEDGMPRLLGYNIDAPALIYN